MNQQRGPKLIDSFNKPFTTALFVAVSEQAPVVVMGYWNPVHRYGFRRWARPRSSAGSLRTGERLKAC